MSRKLFLTAFCLALSISTVDAHHSTAMFDRTRKIWVEGTVKDWQWTNPHAWLQVMTEDKPGVFVEQGFELGSPNTLIRDGFRRDSFKPGDKVRVLVSPRIDGSLGGLYYCAKNAEGKWLIFGMGPNGSAPDECKG